MVVKQLNKLDRETLYCLAGYFVDAGSDKEGL